MTRTFADLEPVYVLGIGLSRYQLASETSYAELGLTAVRAALEDAGIAWPQIESTYVSTARIGTSGGRAMLKHLGSNAAPLVHVENASASGSWAFRLACREVAAGLADVALAVGVDKPAPPRYAFTQTGVPSLADDLIPPMVHFALMMDDYARTHSVAIDDIALVALKNHANGALNPFAHRQKAQTIEAILGGRPLAGHLTALQCCPVGEGGAAAIVVSREGMRKLGLDDTRAIRVASSAAMTETLQDNGEPADVQLTRDTTVRALRDAAITAGDLDLIEMHDAFAIEELQYLEAMGVCRPGETIGLLKSGAFNINGRCAVSPSGGLLAMGHPVGPTGIGQVAEVTRQLRAEAGVRQHKGAKTGLAHMVGLGSVCCVHVLKRD